MSQRPVPGKGEIDASIILEVAASRATTLIVVTANPRSELPRINETLTHGAGQRPGFPYRTFWYRV